MNFLILFLFVVLIAYYLLAWLCCFAYLALFIICGFRYNKEFKEAIRNAGFDYYIGETGKKCAPYKVRCSIILDLLKDRPEKSARICCFLWRNYKKFFVILSSALVSLVLAFVLGRTVFGKG